MLFNEPKLLKCAGNAAGRRRAARFSALQRAEIAETPYSLRRSLAARRFSALQRAEIAETTQFSAQQALDAMSFSALQRAEIAETSDRSAAIRCSIGFSALQRAEIAETHYQRNPPLIHSVSVLFNEPKLLKRRRRARARHAAAVSVLFNEPKLLKYHKTEILFVVFDGVSVLFNEPKLLKFH